MLPCKTSVHVADSGPDAIEERALRDTAVEIVAQICVQLEVGIAAIHDLSKCLQVFAQAVNVRLNVTI